MPHLARFKFKRPETTEERVEAIYDELLESPRGSNGAKPVESLKDNIVALLHRARAWDRERAESSEKIITEQSSALAALAFLSAVFVLNGWSNSRDWDWLNQNRFAIRLWGSAFAAIYIGVSIERTSFFRSLWSFAFTKLVVSVAFSALLVFSTGRASALVNGVFGVDAAAFPYTRAFMAGFIAVNYLSIVLIVVTLFAILQAFNVVGFIRAKLDDELSYSSAPWGSAVYLLIALFFLAISWRWTSSDFSEDALPTKTYRLARVLDFNDKHHLD